VTAEQARPRRQLRASEVRWMFYLLVVLGIAGWKFLPRPWKPPVVLETEHYVITSAADRGKTEEIGRVVEMLHATYSNRFGTLPGFKHEHPKLKLRLYRDRKQFRWANPNVAWAEAYYRKPYCCAYYSKEEINPYHWMLHEAVHQLNTEVAHLSLAKWLDEGLAEYFSTSRIVNGQLLLGQIDPNTYPVWWMDELATAPDLQTNLANGSVIPLRAIITNRGGPSLNKEFNLYYLHWWTLTYFTFQSEKHREAATVLVQQGGGIEAFEQLIGPVQTVQADWHDYVKRMKAALAGTDLEFLKHTRIPAEPSTR
jgi:hypothetical protein